jgi:hypothetical protein
MGKFYIYDPADQDFLSDPGDFGDSSTCLDEAHAWKTRASAEAARDAATAYWKNRGKDVKFCVFHHLRPLPERNYVVKDDEGSYSTDVAGEWVDELWEASRFTRDEALKMVGYLDAFASARTRIVKVRKKS